MQSDAQGVGVRKLSKILPRNSLITIPYIGNLLEVVSWLTLWSTKQWKFMSENWKC